ncbi:MAG: hypothetical protein M3O87_04125 [Candidatus Dormibacteraeota bacterium]|nr:hypothetical protein [Candidatus Dormibacteraeota bacterium]
MVERTKTRSRKAAHAEIETCPACGAELGKGILKAFAKSKDKGDGRSCPECPRTRKAREAIKDAAPLTAGERAEPGGLSAAVLAYLADHKGEDFSPAGLGKALQRSNGAIAKALAKFTAAGVVVQTSQAPRRYRVSA